MKFITHPTQEELLYGYEIYESIENQKHLKMFNFRDIDKFYPKLKMPINYFESNSKSIEITEKYLTKEYIDMGLQFCGIGPNDNPYFLDMHSGLLLKKENSNFFVSSGGFTSKEYDIIDTFYLRQYIKNESFRKSFIISDGMPGEITSLLYLGYNVSDIYREPIIEYSVNSTTELNQLINELTKILSTSKFFRKLWFRGQTKEYKVHRSKEFSKLLKIPNEYCIMPSLMPSLKRQMCDIDTYNNICNESLKWTAAFRFWVLLQNKSLVNRFPEIKNIVLNLLDNYSAEKVCEYCSKDYSVEDVWEMLVQKPYTYADYLVTQQYGGLSSMLDITDDIDNALFFSQSKLDVETKKYKLIEPTADRIIYLFAQCRNTCTYELSSNIFNYYPVDWKCKMPKRIENQKCGLLYGANNFASNAYAYRIIAKIHLSSSITTNKSVDEMFPNQEDDDLYDMFTKVTPKLNGLYG